MYTIGSDQDSFKASTEVLIWKTRTSPDETISGDAAAILASAWASQSSPAMAKFVKAYQVCGNPLAGHSDTDVDNLVMEIEARRREIFSSSSYTADEKEWNCDDLDALQAWVEIRGGVRARV